MILVRQVFQVKYGQMDKVMAMLKAAMDSGQSTGSVSRVLTDISGNNFTLVVETKAESLDAFWEGMLASFQNEELMAQGDVLMQYVESGYREFYTIEFEAEG